MNSPTAIVQRWLAGPVPADVSLALDRLANTDDVRYIAVMPDVHLSEHICTGMVVATKQRLFPHAVGNDIGCGMATIRFSGDWTSLTEEVGAARLLAGLYRVVPGIRHARNTMPETLPENLTKAPLSHQRLEKLKARDGRVEFATLGRGNHFIEFQADEAQQLWLMIHSGSRAMGQAINEHHLAKSVTSNSGLPFLDAESEEGRSYLADLDWACRYAEQSRCQMVDAVATLVANLFELSPEEDTGIVCNHNHLRREVHFGEDFWVHRKGAISARDGEPGIIPGSMGTNSFHVTGRGCPDALCSSSHGAGRCMSRSEAFRSIPTRQFCRQMDGIWFDQRLAGKLRDEAPSAYKDIRSVMRAQRDLTRIVRKLRPILSYKSV